MTLWLSSSLPAPGPAQAEDAVRPASSKHACQFALAWGHTWNAKSYANKHRGQNFIIQGCNVGTSGSGALEALGVNQEGPNGDWFTWANNEYGNGGFHLLETWHSSGGRVISRNNLQGFMRLTQFHTIGMLLEAEKKVRSGECREAKIEFICTAEKEDLTQREFDRRVAIAFDSTPSEPQVLPKEDFNYLNHERQRLLHRAAQYCGKDLVCLQKDGPSSYIRQCGKSLTLKAGDSITDECRKCYEFLNKYPYDPAFQSEISQGIDPAVAAEIRHPDTNPARVVGAPEGIK
jgi:hypothetical protein